MFERVSKRVFIAVIVMLLFCGVQGCTEPEKSADDSDYTNSIGIEFVKIPAGEFMMGSPSDEGGIANSGKPVHEVTIENSYYLGKYEVSQEQWKSVMGNNPSHFKGDDLPVEYVSWYDAQEFINKLNAMEGTDKYRLPSEAEWEYACRAGTTTRYFFGGDESKLGDYAWYCRNSDEMTHPVGQKKPNSWGLYGMSGNVLEWCQDEWYDNYDGAPSDGSAWEGGNSSRRVIRSGSWNAAPTVCHSAFRFRFAPYTRVHCIGFRLLRSL
ncbi:formylglycine-generating enzyme family protein [Methanosarcina sp. Mfa9]|uniref:formylglycine-generating enzyme family protein n=1 Tax=Methanosarcina sp. Mfa9 TaxID=3439063 RepID=UPI003F851EF8